jgi:CheY-like chemotaxis protein
MQKVIIAETDRVFTAQAEAALTPVYELEIVSSREVCLDLAMRKIPDLIVVGRLEPRGEAFTLCRRLRQEPATREIPILVVDVCAHEHARRGWTRSEGMQLEAEGYVTRPLSDGVLREEIAEILARCRCRREGWQEVLEETERRLKSEAESWRRLVGTMLRKAEAEALEIPKH